MTEITFLLQAILNKRSIASLLVSRSNSKRIFRASGFIFTTIGCPNNNADFNVPENVIHFERTMERVFTFLQVNVQISSLI